MATNAKDSLKRTPFTVIPTGVVDYGSTDYESHLEVQWDQT